MEAESWDKERRTTQCTAVDKLPIIKVGDDWWVAFLWWCFIIIYMVYIFLYVSNIIWKNTPSIQTLVSKEHFPLKKGGGDNW